MARVHMYTYTLYDPNKFVYSCISNPRIGHVEPNAVVIVLACYKTSQPGGVALVMTDQGRLAVMFGGSFVPVI